MNVLYEGNLEVYIERCKTEQECHGFVFDMTGEKMNGFSIPEILARYADSLDLKDSDYLFPWLRGAGKDRAVKIGHEYLGYSVSAMQLKRFCMINGILVLTMHSGRRCGAMVAMEMGMTKTQIQAVGNWISS